MDSFEFNKLVGAFLGVVFVVFSVGIISDSIFAALMRWTQYVHFSITPRLRTVTFGFRKPFRLSVVQSE